MQANIPGGEGIVLPDSSMPVAITGWMS